MEKRLRGAAPLLMILAAAVLGWIVQPPQVEERLAVDAVEDRDVAVATYSPLTPGSILYIPADAQGMAKLVYEGELAESHKRIALTFDSGWIAEYTPALLDILRSEGVPATFFHRGKWAESNSGLVKQMVLDGHLIGNHSYTHPHMNTLSREEVDLEITLAHELLAEITGYSPWLYRPPYGSCTPAIRETLSQLGYTHSVMWSVDTHDWKDPGVQYIVRRVLDNATDGAIVLMHVGAPQTVEALPHIITGLRTQGFAFVLVDDLLLPRGTSHGLLPYRVRIGDTLDSLASMYSVNVDEIVALNPALNRTP